MAGTVMTNLVGLHAFKGPFPFKDLPEGYTEAIHLYAVHVVVAANFLTAVFPLYTCAKR